MHASGIFEGLGSQGSPILKMYKHPGGDEPASWGGGQPNLYLGLSIEYLDPYNWILLGGSSQLVSG